jgi:hypothetical protein
LHVSHFLPLKGLANAASCSSPMVSSLSERLPFSLKPIVDAGLRLTLVNLEAWDQLIILMLSVRTEGADEQPALLMTEGVVDLAQLLRELATWKVGLLFETPECHSLIPSEGSLLSPV